MWQNVNEFKNLKVPAKDKNIILSFHFYEPFLLTHYKANWIKNLQIENEIQYPGKIIVQENDPNETNQTVLDWRNNIYDKNKLFEMVNNAIKVAKKYNLPLYCGEVGCIYNNVPPQSRKAWFADITSLFKENDIAFTVWDYKGGFKLFNSNLEPEDSELIEIITN